MTLLLRWPQGFTVTLTDNALHDPRPVAAAGRALFPEKFLALRWFRRRARKSRRQQMQHPQHPIHSLRPSQ